jgi:hypothetical protein
MECDGIVLGAWLTDELSWGMRGESMEEEEEGMWPSRGNMRRTWRVDEDLGLRGKEREKRAEMTKGLRLNS